MRSTTLPRRGLVAATALLALLPVAAGCSSDDETASGTPAAAEAGATPAPGQEAATVALEEDRTAIDVRTPEEYAEGHVDGAANLNFQGAEFADQIAALDPDATYVVYCRSGNRSAQAAVQMRELGLDVIDGGALTDMEAAGWPTA
jgi:rhodanese-related sulfurtransferase